MYRTAVYVLSVAVTLTGLASAQSLAAKLMAYPDSVCNGRAVEYDISYVEGIETVINLERDEAYKALMLLPLAGGTPCRVLGCYYGASCYNTGVRPLAENVCVIDGEHGGWNFDKVVVQC
ncbi:hypothetical protein FALBO_1155 [Fusarium albosuccineum]|uniref:Integron gene cassette protein n=1 Tax=Fusarium albosuccineum TaxID=1237068 RepID=A0A8H4LQF2_9HYPO|nr:hypothetical protein FALBO_1155 [Fusarium albosuccineum]